MTDIRPFEVTGMAGKILLRIPIEIFRSVRTMNGPTELKGAEAVRHLYSETYRHGYPVSMEEHETQYCVQLLPNDEPALLEEAILACLEA